jgi:hypothetical protein
VSALCRLLKFHSVSLCGRLYPLPRRATFRWRYTLHLIEARSSVAYVRGIFERLLTLLGKSELGCGDPIATWLAQLCHCFPSSGTGLRWLYHRRLDQPCAPRGSSISFLTRTSLAGLDSAWVGFDDSQHTHDGKTPRYMASSQREDDRSAEELCNLEQRPEGRLRGRYLVTLSCCNSAELLAAAWACWRR